MREHRASRAVVVASVIALSAPGVPAAGAEPEAGDSRPMGVEEGRTKTDAWPAPFALSTAERDAGRAHDPIALLHRNGGSARPAAWVSTVEQLLELNGADIVNPLPAQDPPDGTEGSDAARDVLSRDATPLGDVNGDGLTDVLVLELFATGSGYDIDLVMVRGTDGTELVRRTLGSEYGLATPVGDLTGDGAVDVLTLSLDVSDGVFGGCLLACAIADVSTWVWTTQVISGADGSSVWAEATPGEVRSVLADAPVNGVVVGASVGVSDIDATAFLVLPYVGVDRNDDAADDVILNVIDLTSRFARGGAGVCLSIPLPSCVVSRATYEDTETATTATVVSGADGSSVAGPLETGVQRGVSWLVPAGRSTGDDRADLLWLDLIWRDPAVCVSPVVHCRRVSLEPKASSLQARLVDGSTLDVAWTTTSFIRDAMFTPLTDDLDGDGSDDILLAVQSNEKITRRPWSQQQIALLDGASGSPVWTAIAEGAWVVAPIDGGAAPDIVSVRFDTEGLFVDRLDGSTGVLLFSTTRWLPTGVTYPAVYLMGDADSDDVADIGVVTSTMVGTTGYVDSSATGSEILVITLPERSGPSLTDAGDLNGDGRDDVVLAASEYRYDRDTITFAAAGSSGLLWMRSHRFNRLGGFRIAGAGNLTDPAGEDLLLVWNDGQPSSEGRPHSGVEAASGTSGDPIWAMGDTLEGPG